jgi:NADH-quinone oxidoreductase subunit L
MGEANAIGINAAWVIPALSASAFFLIIVLNRVLGYVFPGSRVPSFVAPVISIGAMLAGFVLFWVVLVDLLQNGPGTFSIAWLTVGETEIQWGVLIDKLSVVMIGLVTFIALLVQIYSIGYMKGDPRFGWYFAAHALFAGAMLALVLADNLLFLYVAWELVGLGSYLLIGFWWEKRSAAQAAKKAFITTRIGDVGLLIGIILLFRATGSFDISTIFHVAASGGIGSVTLNTATALIFLGAMGKSAQFPFHVWLPDAMEGPTPVSALIHAATMVTAGVFLVARMLPLFELAPDVMMAVAITALAATLFHLVAHGVSKALLFLGAGSVMHGSDGETDARKMGGLRAKMPITAVTFIIGAAGLAGLPPLAGFFSKDEVLLGVWADLNPAFLVVALFGVFLSALYMARVVLLVFFGPLNPEREGAHESPPVMWVPLAILAVLALGVGFLAFNYTTDYQGFAGFMSSGHHFEVTGWLMGLSIAITLGAFAGAWLAYSRNTISHAALAARFPVIYKVLVNKYYIDEAYQWVIDHVVLVIARAVALFDRVVINDTGVDGLAISVRLSAMRTRVIQTGYLYTYGAAMVFGVVGLALIWWIFLT